LRLFGWYVALFVSLACPQTAQEHEQGDLLAQQT
jgi:hypothetical protein